LIDAKSPAWNFGSNERAGGRGWLKQPDNGISPENDEEGEKTGYSSGDHVSQRKKFEVLFVDERLPDAFIRNANTPWRQNVSLASGRVARREC
jgi:hypothetical protein